MPVVVGDSWQFRGKVKQVIKLVIGEGFHCSNDEFLIDLALAFTHTVDLAYRYSHSCGQFREVFVVPVAELKDPCFHYHGNTPKVTCGNMIATNMPFVK
jgi:hypothetical protein